jgi:LacI family transcriptional regulator
VKQKTKLATVHEVARLAGVSASTVSRYLNKNGYVGKETRREIKRAMELIDFVPSAAARSLRRQRSMVVGLAVRHVDYFATANDPFFSLLFTGLAKIFSPAGYGLQVVETHPQAAEERTGTYYLEKVRERSVDGLVIADSLMGEPEILELQQYGTPFVLVNELVERFAGRCVLADDRAKGYELAKVLFERGHRHLSFIGHNHAWSETKGALQGVREAVAAHGGQMTDRDVLFVESGTDEDQLRLMAETLERMEASTGLVCPADDLTGRVAQLLHRGVKVPAGFEFAGQRLLVEEIVRKEFVAAIHPVNREMGIAAGHLLMSLLAGEAEGEEPVIVPMGPVIEPQCDLASALA